MKIVTQVSRVFVGVLFIFSGLIKANDTLGFSYKLEEYFEVFQHDFPLPEFIGIDWMTFSHHASGLSMFICVFEIMVGVALLLGAYSKLNAWLLLLMNVFFLVLTGYSAVTHKITDCGCFGDAIKMSPMDTFLKDVVLTALSVVIFAGHSYIKDIFNNRIYKNLALFVALVVTTFFTFYTYMFLPKIDFLPYKEGNNIAELMVCPPDQKCDSFEMVFIYEKGGKQFEFTVNTVGEADSTYTFVERKDKLVREGYKIPISDFKLYDADGIEYTDSLLFSEGFKLVFVQRNISESRKNQEPIVAKLADDWQKAGRKFWALTASPMDQVEVYRHEHQLAFPYYMMDGTPLKSMVRSNPGLILMNGTTIVKKWSAYNLPTYEIVQKYMR